MDDGRKITVVIRWFDIFGSWGICHANSYQNAFRSSVNDFKQREDAVSFAENNSCVVVQHSYDDLQNHCRAIIS